MKGATDELRGLKSRLQAAERARGRSDLLLAALAVGAGYGTVEANKDEIREVASSLLRRLRRMADEDELPELPWSGG